MFTRRSTLALAPGAALWLGGCAEGSMAEPTMAPDSAPTMMNERSAGMLRTVFRGSDILNANGVVPPGKMERMIDEIDGGSALPDKQRVRNIIQLVEDETVVTPPADLLEKMRGVGATAFYAILKGSLAVMKDAGVSSFRPFRLSVHGAIDATCRDTGTPGFAYDHGARSWRLCITMNYDIMRPNGDCVLQLAYDHHCEMSNCNVWARNEANPDNVFPGSKIPVKIGNSYNAEDAPFLCKLEALAENVVTVSVYEAVAAGTGSGACGADPTSFSAVNYPLLLARSPESCVDMMFITNPPPATLPSGPPFYCLGRCRNPMLINTN